ncbi:PREDICTED: haloacid dehalogenase-like hydrolase domain-containing protein At3g48420 isoform X1 [Nicotiana attenuata]|uniref:Haloacid dehalogenase-like hydrolase domain-containing protein n=2 Tax=Nicotiana attenuata TaxID=49451 RepID=A0A1J6IPM2_NICAT|nr:PREDICTED: haloacid dehalogenase-like hydrolase domain-containing protein At3g48420 isoform X1 [Nicotiana attenuata]OIT06196.1 haloacid dehalogenase-like hydrolase domain-containing protein [Nicotiana attenuata]
MAMETASCPILKTFCFSTNNSSKLYNVPRKSLSFLPPKNYLSTTSSIGKLYSDGYFVNSSSSFSSSTQDNPPQQLALLLEVEGVLMDVYRLGNRQAFNAAFRKLGLDCANWSQPVYQDLVRKSIGDEEKMLVLFFNRIGWPTSLPTSEKETFMKSVLREKKIALDELVMSKSLPLRPGVEEFIDEAYEEGVPVVMLTSYCKCGEKPARSIIEKLGNDKMARIKILGMEEVKQSFYGQLVFGEGVASDLGEQLAKEARKAVSAEEQRIAKEVASMLKLSVDIDTTSSEEMKNVVAALRAGAEYANVPVDNCVLVAGSQSGVAGAERIGMPCVVVRGSSTARAEFPGAKAIMDGFGGGDLSISRLRQIQRS